MHQPLFPYPEATCVRSLQTILPIDYGLGLVQRPELVRSQETAAVVQQAVLSTCKPGRFGGAGRPEIPTLEPVVNLEMPADEKPDVLAALRLRAWKKTQDGLAPLARTQ